MQLEPEARAITLLLGPMWSAIVNEERQRRQGAQESAESVKRENEEEGDSAMVASLEAVKASIRQDQSLGSLLGVGVTRKFDTYDGTRNQDDQQGLYHSSASVLYRFLDISVVADNSVCGLYLRPALAV